MKSITAYYVMNKQDYEAILICDFKKMTYQSCPYQKQKPHSH